MLPLAAASRFPKQSHVCSLARLVDLFCVCVIRGGCLNCYQTSVNLFTFEEILLVDPEVKKERDKRKMAADGNRVGAHMGQLHILEENGRHMATRFRLNYFTHDSSCTLSVIVQDRGSKQDRNGQTDKRATTKKNEIVLNSLKKNESGADKRFVFPTNKDGVSVYKSAARLFLSRYSLL